MTTSAPVVHMRAGDRLPTLAFVIEDNAGLPANLTGARATLYLQPLDDPITLSCPIAIASPAAGIVVHDWDQAQTDALRPGVYNLSIGIEYVEGAQMGHRFTAPTDSAATLVMSSNVVD